MADKRTAIMKLREQELTDIKGWCKCLKAAHRLGLSEGRQLGSMSALLNLAGLIVVQMLILSGLVPNSFALLGGVIVLIWIILIDRFEAHLAKKYLKQHNDSVDDIETKLIKQFDERMEIKKGDKK